MSHIEGDSGVQFICYRRCGLFMRRAILLSLIILLSLPMASATTISADTDEGPNGTLAGNYLVNNSSTWTLSGDYMVTEGTTIIVEEGAVMEVTGTMDVVSARLLQLSSTANVSVPIEPSIRGLPGTLSINFYQPIFYEITIEINGEEFDFGDRPDNVDIENWGGESKFEWNDDFDGETIILNITTHPFQQFPSISNVTLVADDTGVTPVLITPAELSGTGTTVIIPTRTWSIDVQGTLIVSGTIIGAEISCAGTCTLDGADMQSTGPIEVTGSISVTNSNLMGGTTDEDIIIYDDATIEWVASSGTGGVTDQWINVLTTRTVGVQNSNVILLGSDLGYDSYDTNYLIDCQVNEPEDCDNIIDFNLNERGRMIRWQDGNGILHVESASASFVLDTPWGTFYHNVSNLPKENHFDVVIDLPILSFDSLVVSDSENAINDRLGVMATVSNSGSVTAKNVNIDCVSNGEDANIGLLGITHTIEAGETLEIPMNWDSPNEGDFALECSIFIPDDFTEIVVTSKESAITEKVTWTEETDESENMVIPIAIGVVVALVLFVVVSRLQASKADMEESVKDTSEDVHDFEQEVDDEETGTIE